MKVGFMKKSVLLALLVIAASSSAFASGDFQCGSLQVHATDEVLAIKSADQGVAIYGDDSGPASIGAVDTPNPPASVTAIAPNIDPSILTDARMGKRVGAATMPDIIMVTLDQEAAKNSQLKPLAITIYGQKSVCAPSATNWELQN
jgi:hypothetical protein